MMSSTAPLNQIQIETDQVSLKRKRPAYNPNDPASLYAFSIQYYAAQNSKSEILNMDKMRALGIDIARIKLVKTPRNGIIGTFSTVKKFRLREICNRLNASAYNKADRQGLQIAGENGLHIYANDKTDDDVQALHDQYSTWVKEVIDYKNHVHGSKLGAWTKAEWAMLMAEKKGRAEMEAYQRLYGDGSGGGGGGDDDDDDDDDDDVYEADLTAEDRAHPIVRRLLAKDKRSVRRYNVLFLEVLRLRVENARLQAPPARQQQPAAVATEVAAAAVAAAAAAVPAMMP
jgi:hypothetical protein